jgi:lipopolysaccharide transport system ATP-binding protein
MYMRLAFAVAAHLEPEVLLVDEVLAVGDASFQKRCLDKMRDVSRHGRTVLFVSHNMPAVTRLCGRTILLDRGHVLADGPSHQVVSAYLSSGLGTTAAREWRDPASAPGNGVARLRAVRVRVEGGRVCDAVDIRRPVGIEMEYDVLEPGHVLVPNYHVFNEEGTCVFVALEHHPDWKRRPRPVGRHASTAWIPGNFLAEGTLIVTAALSTMDPVTVHFCEPDAVAFQVVDSCDGDSARGDLGGQIPGVVRPLLEWTTRFDGD